MALPAQPRAARSDRVRPREELVVCLGVACAFVSSSWQAAVRAYLAVPDDRGWGPWWCYDHQSRLLLEGAHALVVEGVLQQNSGNLCETADHPSAALSRLVIARRPFACAHNLVDLC